MIPIDKVFYGYSRLDTAEIGLRDDEFYQHIKGEAKVLELCECDRESCLALFESYKAIEDKIQY